MMLLVFGASQMAIAWFALRQGQWWGLWVLIVIDVVFIIGWTLVYGTYIRAGAPLSLTTAPPNLWIPAVLLIPAAVLSYLGLRALKG